MGNSMIAFFLAAGVAAWVYNKLSRSTGGNTKNALTAAIIVGIFAFIVMIIALGLIPSN